VTQDTTERQAEKMHAYANPRLSVRDRERARGRDRACVREREEAVLWVFHSPGVCLSSALRHLVQNDLDHLQVRGRERERERERESERETK